MAIGTVTFDVVVVDIGIFVVVVVVGGGGGDGGGGGGGGVFKIIH